VHTWTLDFTYRRPDLPKRLEVLLTAQTGAEDDHGDRVAEYDWIHVAPSRLDRATLDALAAGTADSGRVIAELGD
jgi:hypothetical protein